jgi:hypothetical protein
VSLISAVDEDRHVRPVLTSLVHAASERRETDAMHDPDSDYTICNINADTPSPIFKAWNPLPSFDAFRSVLADLQAEGVLTIDNASTDGYNHFAFICAHVEDWIALLGTAIHAQAAEPNEEENQGRQR